MQFHETTVHGAYVTDGEPKADNRGFFARVYCDREYTEANITPKPWVQVSLSFNRTAGTLRGLHFQREPEPERKLVTCVRGAIHDVIVDLRPDSSTYRASFSVQLRGDQPRSLYVPEGCAHGFQTLEDDTLILYHTSTFYVAELQDGVRYDDPAFNIEWPLPVTEISDRDRGFPLLATD